MAVSHNCHIIVIIDITSKRHIFKYPSSMSCVKKPLSADEIIFDVEIVLTALKFYILIHF